MSSSDIVVDPENANHLYLATLRGRGGIRRTTPPARRRSASRSPPTAVPPGRCARHDQRVPRCDRPGDGPARTADPVGVVLGRRDLPLHERWRDLDDGDGQPARRELRPPAPGSRSASRTRPVTRPRRSTPASTTPTTGAHDSRSSGRPEDGATWAQTGTGGPATTRQHPRLLHDPVLLRQRDIARPEEREHGLRQGSYGYDQSARAVRRDLPQHRRRPAGRASATTCTRTSTRSPSTPATTSTS